MAGVLGVQPGEDLPGMEAAEAEVGREAGRAVEVGSVAIVAVARGGAVEERVEPAMRRRLAGFGQLGGDRWPFG